MTPIMLRHIWSVVETTQANLLVNLDDASLVQWLLGQLRTERSLNRDELCAVNSYIRSRTALIRDLAQQRMIGEPL